MGMGRAVAEFPSEHRVVAKKEGVGAEGEEEEGEEEESAGGAGNGRVVLRPPPRLSLERKKRTGCP